MLDASSDLSLVCRYYLYRATVSTGFITPVFTLFLLRSLSFAQVGALSALYSALSVAGEVPTGYVGDRLGRRASLLLSVACTVGSLGGLVVFEGFLAYAGLYALWALAMTFRSGSMDAWLYDALDERLDAGQFSRVRGRGDAVQKWIGAVSMVAGGALYGVDPEFPFVAAVALNGLGFAALLSLPKNRRYADADDGDGDERHDRFGPLEALGVAREHLTRPSLRSLVLYFGLFSAVVGVANSYLQPMAVETLGPLTAGLGVEIPAGGAVAAARSGTVPTSLALGLGLLYASLTAVSSVGGYYAGAVEDRLGVRRTVLLVPAVMAVGLVVPIGVALLALPAFAAMRTAPSLVRPVAFGYVNDRIADAGRATLLSVVSMVTMALRTPLALGAGLVADATTATAAVAALGALFLGVGGAVWLFGDVAPEVGPAVDDRPEPPAS